MKKCLNCGRECLDTDKFCLSCGTPLASEATPETEAAGSGAEVVGEQAAQTQEAPAQAAPVQAAQTSSGSKVDDKVKEVIGKVKALPAKTLGIIGGAAAVVILLIIIIACSGGSKCSFAQVKEDAYFAIYSDLEETVMFANSKGKIVEFSEDNIYDLTRNMDGSIIAFTINDEDALYVMNGAKDPVEVETDVIAFYMSDSGNGIAYLTDYDYIYQTGTLYLYDVAKKKSTKIDTDVYTSGIAISPDGKTVAYVKEYSILADSFKSYVSINGKDPESFTKSAIPFAVADGAKYIYYRKNSDVYVQKKADDSSKVKLASDISTSFKCFFNEDYSQMLYNYDGNTYYSKNCKDKVLVAKRTVNSIIIRTMWATRSIDSNFFTGTTLTTDDFKNLVINFEGSLYYITNSMETEKIVSSYSRVNISDDGNSIIYSNNDSLYYVKNLKKSREAVEIAEDIDLDYFVASADMSYVYYRDNDDTLYYKKGTGKAKKIADDVYSMVMDYDNDVVFFLVDYDDYGELYYSKKGGSKKAVKSGSETYSLRWNNDNIYFLVDGDSEYDLYYQTGKTSFKLLLKDVYSTLN